MLLDETIPKPDHGLDVVASRAELQAEPADVGVDAARLDVALVAPDPLQEPIAGEHAPRPLDHGAEELELLVGEPDLLAAVAHDIGIELHLEVLVAVALGRLSRGADPAQGHPAARGQR